MDFIFLRKEKNITQCNLSKKLNVSQTSISKWESGKAKPRLDKIHDIAVVLGVSDEDVLNCFIKSNIESK